MNKGVMKKWVKALRSGKYEQGNGALCRDWKYCCLGVLCEVAIREGIKLEKKITSGLWAYSYNTDKYSLPPEVKSWAGLRTCDGSSGSEGFSLAELNDGISIFKEGRIKKYGPIDFDQIAAYIEANYEVL